MATIKPTVDSVGDAALTNSLIDRSITELQDDLLTSIRQYAFQGCTALKKLVFGSVESLGSQCFRDLSALEWLELYKTVSFGSYQCRDSNLSTLILRGDTMCPLSTTTAFNGTPIASGTGYIYVPAALVDTYKADSYWGNFSGQIRAIEDYPEVCDPYSWEAVAKAIEAGTYKDVYKIGDEVPVDLGSEGLINMQIAAFDADTLADGSGTAAISWVGKELLKTARRWNPKYVTDTEGTGVFGGWEKSELRSYLKESIYPMLPDAVKGAVVSVSKISYGRNASTSGDMSSVEDVWIPNTREIFANTLREKTGVTYSGLFVDSASRIKTIVGTETKATYWTRSRDYDAAATVALSSGVTSSSNTENNNYVCLGFCTGKTLV